MSEIILSSITASITELKINPMGTVKSAEGNAIAILNRSKPEFYCVPAKLYHEMLEKLEDLELIELMKEREGQKEIRVKFNDL